MARNPYKKILKNAQGGQNLNQYQVDKGIQRTVKEVNITEEDIERIFIQQGGLSASLGIPINLDDIFKSHFPLSPSIDRIDNDKDYTPDNIRINTRFENWGFNRASEEDIQECIKRLVQALRKFSPSDTTRVSEIYINSFEVG